MFDCLLFDLDGTLTDSFEGIANSAIYAHRKLGAPIPSKSDLLFFVGPPIETSFRKMFGGDESKTMRAVELYREYYTAKGWAENTVYDGVENTLNQLKTLGKRLAVATSKPEEFSVKILKHFGLDKYFDLIAGATFDMSRATKDKVIEYALEKLSTDREKTVMIGDRYFDILGAKKNGLKSVGVLYGYGSRKELTDAGADHIVETPGDILNIV